MTLSEANQAWNGFASLFFQASHNFVSEAESFLSICALVIAGFGFGDGDACGSGCAKQKEANAMTSIAARGKCFFILGLSPRSCEFCENECAPSTTSKRLLSICRVRNCRRGSNRGCGFLQRRTGEITISIAAPDLGL